MKTSIVHVNMTTNCRIRAQWNFMVISVVSDEMNETSYQRQVFLSVCFHIIRRLQWHALGREEQAKYYELARRERQLHMQLYPDWSSRANTQRGKKRKRKQETTDGGTAPPHSHKSALPAHMFTSRPPSFSTSTFLRAPLIRNVVLLSISLLHLK